MLDGQLVAVKRFEVSTDDTDDKTALADFYRETKILSRLKHPNIIRFIGACTKWPNLAIVMDFAPHGSLMGLLENTKQPFPWPLRLKIAVDIAKGCHYLHCNKVLHRDLKSPNILLMSLDTSDDVVSAVVTDFNTSKVTEKRFTLKKSITFAKASQIGTLAWTAPEVLDEKFPDDKGDVYSYAIILWEIASRQMPYPVAQWKFDYQVAAHVIKGGRLPIPSGCPPKWAESPTERPPFSDILYDLEQLRARKDKLEQEGAAAALIKAPADIKEKHVLWVTDNQAQADSTFAALTKENPDVSYVILKNPEALHDWLKEHEALLSLRGGAVTTRIIYSCPAPPAEGGSMLLAHGPAPFLHWLRTSPDSPFPRTRVLLVGGAAEIPTLSNYADQLTAVTCQPQTVRDFAVWKAALLF